MEARPGKAKAFMGTEDYKIRTRLWLQGTSEKRMSDFKKRDTNLKELTVKALSTRSKLKFYFIFTWIKCPHEKQLILSFVYNFFFSTKNSILFPKQTELLRMNSIYLEKIQ